MQKKSTRIINYIHRLARKRLQNTFSTSGAVLLTVVILLIIIGLSGVAIYSLTTTTTFSQLSSQNAAQAFYLAESGFRVVTEEYNYASGNKNTVLENLHNTTLALPGNAGRFDLRLYPYWFYVDAAYTAGNASISVRVPGGIPLRDPSDPTTPQILMPGSGALKLRGKPLHAFITNASVSGNAITFNLDTSVTPPGFPYNILPGEELFLVYQDVATAHQIISQNSDITLSGSNAVAQILPPEKGSFRIYNENNDKMDYTYRRRTPAVIDPNSPPSFITLHEIGHQNDANPSVFPFEFDSNTEMLLGKNLAVFTSSTVGQGNMAGKKTVINYTDVGTDAGFFTGKETISFAEDIQDFHQKMGASSGGEIFAGDADAPITVDTATKEVELGKNLTGRYGSIWYKGDTDTANCVQGRCNLGKGFNAYFEFQFDDPDASPESKDKGDGFTFSIISAYEDGPGSYRNTAENTGSGGEYLGYAGPGLDEGIKPPKIGLEFDTYPNTKGGNICGSDSRRDGYPPANHTALVYWGEETSGSFDASNGYISLGSASFESPVTREGTISFWFKRDTIFYGNGASSGDRLWGQNANMEMRFSADGHDIILDWGGNDSLTHLNHPFTQTGKWYFLAVAWNETSNNLSIYWGTETMAPELLAATAAWYSSVSGVGVNENLFLNSSGGDGGKNFKVDGQGSELRFYNTQRNLSQIQADYNVRLNGSEPSLIACFPLQADVANGIVTSSINAAVVGDAAWSPDTPASFDCGFAAETYDDNRHGTGGMTVPSNSLNTDAGNGDDGYYQVMKGTDPNNWLEDGQPHLARIELIRPRLPSVDGVVGGTNYEYQIKVWIDCPSCSDTDLAAFKNVKAPFTAWSPLIQKTIFNDNPLILDQTRHDELGKFLFGFTQGTGGATQNITLQDFQLYFLQRYPVTDLATW